MCKVSGQWRRVTKPLGVSWQSVLRAGCEVAPAVQGDWLLLFQALMPSKIEPDCVSLSVSCIVVLKLQVQMGFWSSILPAQLYVLPIWTGYFHSGVSSSCFRKVPETLQELLTWQVFIPGHCFDAVWQQYSIGKSVCLLFFSEQDMIVNSTEISQRDLQIFLGSTQKCPNQ